jgi:MFS family permease
MANFALV